MILLGIEGGGTRTTVLLVDEGNGTVLAEFTSGPGNIHLLPGEALDAHLHEIRERLPLAPDRIGIGLAGVRSEGDRLRVSGVTVRDSVRVEDSVVVEADAVLETGVVLRGATKVGKGPGHRLR